MVPLLALGFSGAGAASVPVFDVPSWICGASAYGVFVTPKIPRASAARAPIESHKVPDFALNFGFGLVWVSSILSCSVVGFEAPSSVVDFTTGSPRITILTQELYYLARSYSLPGTILPPKKV